MAGVTRVSHRGKPRQRPQDEPVVGSPTSATKPPTPATPKPPDQTCHPPGGPPSTPTG